MRQISSPLLVLFLVVALVIGVLGGYFASSQLNKTQVSQSAFLPYTDNYGGLVDDSNSGFVTNAPLVGGFSNGQIAWYWLVGPTDASFNPAYFFNFQSGSPVIGQYPIIDAKPGESGYTHFWKIFNVTVSDNYVPNTIKSLSTLERAQQAGLATITDLKKVINAPLVARNV